MASILNGFIKADELKKISQDKLIKGDKGVRIPITILVNDESRYGNNASIIVSQNEQEREQKAQKHYIGNATVVWTDGTIKKGEKDQDNGSNKGSSLDAVIASSNSNDNDSLDGLPF